MVNPEYKVVDNSLYIPETGINKKTKARLKFVQTEDGVALYDSSMYIGQFVSTSQDKIRLEGQNIVIPASGGTSGIDLNKLQGSDSIEVEKDQSSRVATFSVKEDYLRNFIETNVSIIAKPDGGVVVDKNGSSYELSLDDEYHIDEHSWD